MKFFIASPWRNADVVSYLSAEIRDRGLDATSFLDNVENLATGTSVDDEPDAFHGTLTGWEDDPLVHRIFTAEIANLKASDALILQLEPRYEWNSTPAASR